MSNLVLVGHILLAHYAVRLLRRIQFEITFDK